MGLLDSVLGSVLNSQAQNAQAQGGLGSLVALVANNPQLVQVVMGMLSNEGGHGGLGGLVSKFQQAGMGDVVNSWVGTGANQAVSGNQLTQVLGSDMLSQLGAQLGLGQGEAANQLAQVLPGLVDHFTPQGHAPAGGLGSADDLMGALSGLLQK